MINTLKLMAVPAMLVASGAAHAVITGPVTLDFQDTLNIYYGTSNAVNGPITFSGTNSTNCLTGACYVKDNVVVSTVFDETSVGEHLHRAGGAANRTLQSKGDASGFYVRLTDGSAFTFTSIDLLSPYDEAANPYARFLLDGSPNPDWNSALDRIVIKGFNTAYNPTLWTNPSPDSLVAEAFVDIGFTGTFNALAANPLFNNVNAIWIHPVGRHSTELAGQRDFSIRYDNLSVQPVPVPAAAWLFGSALMAYAAGAKRRFKLTA